MNSNQKVYQAEKRPVVITTFFLLKAWFSTDFKADVLVNTDHIILEIDDQMSCQQDTHLRVKELHIWYKMSLGITQGGVVYR